MAGHTVGQADCPPGEGLYVSDMEGIVPNTLQLQQELVLGAGDAQRELIRGD